MRTASQKQKTYQYGLWAENYAAIILQLKGYKIIKRRYKTRVGEIDLIAHKKNLLVFVEVKARACHDQAIESFTVKMRHRIEQAARFFISQYPNYTQYAMRFDLVTVTPFLGLKHIENAWP